MHSSSPYLTALPKRAQRTPATPDTGRKAKIIIMQRPFHNALPLFLSFPFSSLVAPVVSHPCGLYVPQNVIFVLAIKTGKQPTGYPHVNTKAHPHRRWTSPGPPNQYTDPLRPPCPCSTHKIPLSTNTHPSLPHP